MNRQRIKVSIALLGLFLSLSATALDRGDPRYWLEKMAHAAHSLDYEGTFIYEHHGHLQTMRIVHSVTEEGERERLVTLDGPSREVIRDRGKVTCILPDDKAVIEQSGQAPPFRLPMPDQLTRLEAYYAFSLGSAERIAGLAAQMVAIHPRDGYRYGQNIWVDTDSGLLLKSELLDEKGHVVEQLLFTSLNLHPRVPESLLQPETKGKDLVWYAPDEQTGEFPADPRWQVKSLPEGFRKEVHRKHYIPQIDVPVEHIVFTDGLASVSVFIEPRGEKQERFVGGSRMGAVNAYATFLDNHRITVVGEVPAATVRLLAESVEYEEAE